jgi:hypothetical protein
MKIKPIPAKGKATMKKNKQEVRSAIPTSTTSNTLTAGVEETPKTQVRLQKIRRLEFSQKKLCPDSSTQPIKHLILHQFSIKF